MGEGKRTRYIGSDLKSSLSLNNDWSKSMDTTMEKIMSAAVELERRAPACLGCSTMYKESPRTALKRMDAVAGSIGLVYDNLLVVLDDIKEKINKM